MGKERLLLGYLEDRVYYETRVHSYISLHSFLTIPNIVLKPNNMEPYASLLFEVCQLTFYNRLTYVHCAKGR